MKGLILAGLKLRFSRARLHLSNFSQAHQRLILKENGVAERRKSCIWSLAPTPVMTVTDHIGDIGETPFVNMVRRACKKVLFEPVDTRQQWKGEAAACFVLRDHQ
jgi:hypothetical protein